MVKNKFLQTRVNKLKKEFKNLFADTKGISIFSAPGRINLIGEHTDYNGGYVLGVAINFSILAAAKARKDRKVYLKSQNFPKKFAASLDKLKFEKNRGWANYPLSIAWVLESNGIGLKGANIIYEGNIPMSSGLSSSAAIEVLTMKVFSDLSEYKIAGKQIPIFCKEAENEFLDLKSGMLNQFIITFGKENNVTLLNCETLKHKAIPFPKEKKTAIIIGNTKIKSKLAKSVYIKRASECNQGLKILQKNLNRKDVFNLSHINKQEFDKHRNKIPPLIARRCEHVISENKRVSNAAYSLQTKDLNKLGKIMTESHKSLRELYEVSCKELDIMVDSFLELNNVYGAKMTGAVLGGCTIALAKEKEKEEIIRKVSQAYKKRTGINGEFYVCRISNGARKL